ncbi:ABC transporter permease [Pelagibacterium luteolum]|uniref:Transport permease protein n=1 Tax=Pelagibacterium luteolum TaxID=440168 RepID=A0A1G7XYS6_9HYPH|nr:ABC transporter permease [Pelagibacterium luteolum]SDG89317.1 ABC-2 type transport system permease protein [Pelagibacterium luteolum]
MSNDTIDITIARRPTPGRFRDMWNISCGVQTIWWREVKRSLTDRGQLVGGVSRPLLWVLILGVGLNPFFRGEVMGDVRFIVPYTYLQYIFPGVIVLNILYTSIQSAVSLIWDREFGFLREVLVSPLPRNFILLGKVLGGATTAVVHGMLVLAVARFANIQMGFAEVGVAMALMFLLAFGMTSLGIVIANYVKGFEGFGVFSNALVLPLYFTSSAVFPMDPSLTRAQTLVTYPRWLVMMVEANPVTYTVDTLRGILIGFSQYPMMLGWQITGGLAVAMFCLAMFEFRRL